MAAWVVGQPHMAAAVQMAAERGRHLAFHALGVVKVVLQPGVARAHLVQQVQGLLGAADGKARNVKGVDGRDEQAQAHAGQRVGCKAQVGHQGAKHGLRVCASRQLAHLAAEFPQAQAAV
jgi:hypothetical protein